MECYPPCVACTGLCKVAPVRVTPARAPRNVAPNMQDPVFLACGCLADLIPMVRLFTKDVLCETHGWQSLARERRKPRKRKPANPDQMEMVPF